MSETPETNSSERGVNEPTETPGGSTVPNSAQPEASQTTTGTPTGTSSVQTPEASAHSTDGASVASTDDEKKHLTQGQFTQTLLESFVPGRGKLATFIAIFVVFFVLIGLVLHRVADRSIFQRDEYQITQDQIQIQFLNPDGSITDQQPAWIPRDIREELLNNVRLFNPNVTEPFSLLDPNVVSYFYNACKNHPRVRRVIYIRKQRPASLQILLELHRPVLLITVPRNGKTAAFLANEDGLLQPLADARILDEQHHEIPILEGYHKEPLGTTPGEAWPDTTVHDAANIARTFGPYWEIAGIKTVKVVAPPKTRTVGYELIARNGTTIYWGTAEEPPTANGFSNQKKLEALLAQFPDGAISAGEPQSISFQKQAADAPLAPVP